jgi:hypothetical protein
LRTFAQKPKATQETTSAKSTIPGQAHFGQSHAVDSILRLQHTIGNQAVQRLLQAKPDDLEASSSTSEGTRFVEQPGQKYERLQTRRVGSSNLEQPEAPPIVQEVLHSPGQPSTLPPASLWNHASAMT